MRAQIMWMLTRLAIVLAPLLIMLVGCGPNLDGIEIVGAHDSDLLWAEVGDVGAAINQSGLITTDDTPDWFLTQYLVDKGSRITMVDEQVDCGGDTVDGCTTSHANGTIEIRAMRGRCDIAGVLGDHELIHAALIAVTGDGDAHHEQPGLWWGNEKQQSLEYELAGVGADLCAKFPEN